jgi:hypothetical protein
MREEEVVMTWEFGIALANQHIAELRRDAARPRVAGAARRRRRRPLGRLIEVARSATGTVGSIINPKPPARPVRRPEWPVGLDANPAPPRLGP